MASYWPARSKPGVSHVNQAKAWLACLLKRRALREAGFTEQRLPSSLGSGRITGWCHSDSYGLMGCSNWTIIFVKILNYMKEEQRL
ncbi:hypothetical protein NC653_023235 [Populus alba x Populus x berolinensis]|uniref:Uncharacterized protein n=1 Tax=Populus alba x Populus x berolinensis TaxID=444605 RepID=A0AAD6QAQ9_9ROSI|nr:hypothetical protein NC653_023235 [Populus alba x Populus x berolinensis]